MGTRYHIRGDRCLDLQPQPSSHRGRQKYRQKGSRALLHRGPVGFKPEKLPTPPASTNASIRVLLGWRNSARRIEPRDGKIGMESEGDRSLATSTSNLLQPREQVICRDGLRQRQPGSPGVQKTVDLAVVIVDRQGRHPQQARQDHSVKAIGDHQLQDLPHPSSHVAA